MFANDIGLIPAYLLLDTNGKVGLTAMNITVTAHPVIASIRYSTLKAETATEEN